MRRKRREAPVVTPALRDLVDQRYVGAQAAADDLVDLLHFSCKELQHPSYRLAGKDGGNGHALGFQEGRAIIESGPPCSKLAGSLPRHLGVRRRWLANIRPDRLHSWAPRKPHYTRNSRALRGLRGDSIHHKKARHGCIAAVSSAKGGPF